MVVGDDVAVVGDNEAAAGGGGDLGLLAEDIGGLRDIDADAAVDVGGVELGVAHEGLAVHRHRRHLHRLPAADVDVGLLAPQGADQALGCVPQPEDSAEHQHAAQGEGDHLQSTAGLPLPGASLGFTVNDLTGQRLAVVVRGFRLFLVPGGTIEGIIIIVEAHILNLLERVPVCYGCIIREDYVQSMKKFCRSH